MFHDQRLTHLYSKKKISALKGECSTKASVQPKALRSPNPSGAGYREKVAGRFVTNQLLVNFLTKYLFSTTRQLCMILNSFDWKN